MRARSSSWRAIRLSARTLCVPVVALAAAGVVLPANAEDPEWVPLDSSGTMDRAQLVERWQLLVWSDSRRPIPGQASALGAASARVVYGALAGGFNAGQDIARPVRDADATDPASGSGEP